MTAPFRLRDRWVLITGASSGFGAAAALAFAREGARLLLGARRENRLAEVAGRARELGAVEALFHRLDVSQTPSVEAFAAWVRSVAGRVDVLVNNAGGALGLEPVAEGRDEDWETMLQTNVLGVLRMTRAILPLMLPHPGGIIINIGSIAGRTAYEGGAAYCAAKAGELQITRALRLELCGTGLRVATVDPGMAETEFSVVRFKGDAARAAKVYEGVQPLTAEDVAEAIVWVAGRPPHVCVDEMVIKCTDQAAFHKVHRRPVSETKRP
ncbi:MAG: SDR family NAD(P)-dependent oxidoreductase [Verrucomicrobia bacterium]|nr:SDR family NAD(P)-dependent oxidoreductase [Verrucomicrobiota bacterium]